MMFALENKYKSNVHICTVFVYPELVSVFIIAVRFSHFYLVVKSRITMRIFPFNLFINRRFLVLESKSVSF